MITETDLLNVLQEWNIWEREIDYGIKRKKYLNKIFPLIERKEIIVIKGIRRSGKSTIMKQLMKELVKQGANKKQILYLNLEDYNLRESLSLELLEKTYQTYLKYSKNKKITYYFIDEIQNIIGWEHFLRTKYDLKEKIKFIITGSNASLLSKELSTLLTGRNLTFQVKTLSLSEFYQFKKNGEIEEFLTFGGFPEVILEKNPLNKKILLQQYFEDIINKDIIARNKLRNVELVFNLAKFLIENSGGKISLNKLAKTFGVSDDTIAAYISYMIDSYLLIKVPFFSYSLKKRHSVLTKPKYYATDNGLIYITSLKFSEDLGKRYENSVLLKIYEGTDDITYWSKDNEVDFVYDQKAVNVTATDKIPEREFLGLKEFKKYHKHFELILVSKKEETKDDINVIPFEKFCLDN